MAGDEDTPRDAADTTWADAVAPDDIRELSRDIAAYHRELRRARRERRLRQLMHRRTTLPLIVVTLAALLAGLVAVLLTVMAPRVVEPTPTASPLAHPTLAEGTVGGLLPDVALAGSATTTGIRASNLRPAVLALVPTACGCADLLNDLAGQAYGENLSLVVVVPAASDPTTDGLMSTLTRGSPSLYFDPSAALAKGVGAEGVTLVVVDRDGTIYSVERNVTDPSKTALDATLQSMLLPSRTQ